MNIELTSEQKALQQKVRDYMTTIMTPELAEEMKIAEYKEGGGPEFRKQYARMGEDGWIGLSWSKELGGKEMSHIEQYIFTDEVVRSGFPYPFLTTESTTPVVAANASEAVKEEVVGGVRNGKVVIAIGYSEPSAGTDLASLKTRAVKDGDDWIINGQKMWTSLANFADYVWLAARTDPDESKKHKGLTMFLVPTNSEGFSVTPVHTLGVRTNATYYNDIRLPDKYRVGEVNAGWKLVTGQLNIERLSLFTHGQVDSLYQGVCEWAAETDAQGGGKIIEQPWVQHNLAKVKSGLEVVKLICWKQAWAMDQGPLDMADASTAKVYSSEFFVQLYRLLLEVMGQAGTIATHSPGAVLKGKLEFRWRVGSILTFGGGTNEIQRDIISMAGLWMPRTR
ncbi:acyl-CoA dehydrogenase family protein [Candidatus Marimicrobium litorale]|jgi:3-oxocholest-4-en-26-oyl-CoA dehydrogenase alpha subunit|uniref:Acyl-CoA dehydrogenase n=1 Tax=Candidatus Marimicrobium litorale TaxID=2518991 RepID=A0ABT3T748_9GAMM|nr:acyl-CoA dehydrogenase family protein [Candidatus Marimicrobium litorale]MCX2978015.1 acyl-CoA dehydrogenase [Candidatus Marimicrobium litorale]